MAHPAGTETGISQNVDEMKGDHPAGTRMKVAHLVQNHQTEDIYVEAKISPRDSAAILGAPLPTCKSSASNDSVALELLCQP